MSRAPSLTSASLWNCTLFSFLHFLNSFLFQEECVQPHEAVWLLEGTPEHTGPEETQGPPLVAGHRARSKAGMKGGGICGPLFSFQPKKNLSSGKITLHYAAPPKQHKFPNTSTNGTRTEKLVCSASSHLLLFSSSLTCILHFHSMWLHIFLHSGMIQWVGSILDLLSVQKIIN